MAPTRRAVLGSAATASALALAGCLGEGDGGSPTDAGSPTGTDGGAPTGTPTDGSAAVRVRSHDELGDVLVGPEGLTLYMFDQDTKGQGASTCYDSCASAWPPLTVDGEPTASDAVSAELTTFDRDGGATQVAAAGWPLYYYASDQQPGDATGQGVGGVWWVLRPDGSVVRSDGSGGGGGSGGDGSTATPTATPTPTGGDGGGGGGGGYY